MQTIFSGSGTGGRASVPELLGLAPERNEALDAFLNELEGDAHALPGAAEGAVHHVGVCGAGGDAVDGDLVRGELEGEALGEADDAELGWSVATVLWLAGSAGER